LREVINWNIENEEVGEDNPQLEAMGIQPTMEDLFASLDGSDLDGKTGIGRSTNEWRMDPDVASLSVRQRPNNDFFSGLSECPEIVIEVCKYLRCRDFLSLYAISKDFHETINGHMTFILKNYAEIHAPESSKIFVFTFYDQLCIQDPVRRPHPLIRGKERKVPSLKWAQMVVHRERAVRDILACMAREGHRMPKSMSLTLKKVWLTMDIATSGRRSRFMHNNKFWTNVDLYNVMMFIVKLDLRFNDPIASSGDDGMRKLFLGQRGLTPLRNLLKRTAYKDAIEILKAAVRYQYTMRSDHFARRLSIFGVPWHEIGRGHLEGWGAGRAHLYRIDELVYRESVRRNLNLNIHFEDMMLWGYVDPVTKRDIEVTEEEKYMSEEDDEYEWKTSVGVRQDDEDEWDEIDRRYEEAEAIEQDDENFMVGIYDGNEDGNEGDNESGNEDVNEGDNDEDGNEDGNGGGYDGGNANEWETETEIEN
jgi:hypothetical protein